MKSVFDVVAAAGGGGAAGLERGWTYLALADATHVVRNNSGNTPTNVILSQSDNGTEWTIESAKTWGVDDSGSFKTRNLVGVGDYWHFPLPDSLAALKTWKIYLKLVITDFGATGDEDDTVFIGIGDCGDGTELADVNTGRYAYGGMVNDYAFSGGLMQPDVRYGVKKGSAGGAQSGKILASEGECNTLVVEVCRVGPNITTAVVSSWRPVIIGGGTKLKAIYHATASNLVVSDLKIVIQVGRQTEASADTTIKFKAHYMASLEANLTDFGI